jgi:histidinol-phosphate aminotransferase
MNKDLTKLIRPEIRQLSAYHVPNIDYKIKLDAMENPYIWNKSMINSWLEILSHVSLNRYPNAAANDVKQILRKTMQVPEVADILLGNGSDELIQILTLAVTKENSKLLSIEPSFVMYKILAKISGLEYIGIPLQEHDFSLDLAKILTVIKEQQPELIFLAYPNNPTGNLFDEQALENILTLSKGLVVIDEAYCAFTEHTFMSKLNKYENLLVMRTVSKIGLAGLRLGMLAGSKQIIAELNKIRLPYNINVLTQASAIFALENYSFLVEQTELIKKSRQKLFNQLKNNSKIHVWHSEANFILFRVNNATEIFAKLKEQGILIKCLHGSYPLLDNCLRVTVGTNAENQIFIDALMSL